jgi:hypothetical protein
MENMEEKGKNNVNDDTQLAIIRHLLSYQRPTMTVFDDPTNQPTRLQ